MTWTLLSDQVSVIHFSIGATMDHERWTASHAPRPLLSCEIDVIGTLDATWSDWLGGLVPAAAPDGHTWLRGTLPDQAALLGVLTALHDLGLKVVSVSTATDIAE
jgi:hypothetical protein